MWRVYERLTTEHDPVLVAVALCICAFGAFCTFVIAGRAMTATRRWAWTTAGGISGGLTVWATCFVAMVGLETGVPFDYEPALTLLSLMIGITGFTSGLAVALRTSRRIAMAAVGGAITGAGLTALHLVGMLSMSGPGRLTFAIDLVIAAAIFAVIFGAAAFVIGFGAADRPKTWRLVGASIALFVMTIALHFTAVAAVQMEAGAWSDAPADYLSRTIVGGAVACASLIVALFGFLAAVVDQRVADRLSEDARRFRALAEATFEGIVIHKAGTVIDANAAMRRLVGFPDHSPVEGESIAAWLAEEDRETVARNSVNRLDDPFEVTLVRTDGSRFPAEIAARDIKLSDGSMGRVAAIRDLTARKAAEAKIRELALQDQLTNLSNRSMFFEIAGKVLAQSERTDAEFAVLLIDLDNFRMVNEVHGRPAGDQTLIAIAERIVEQTRDADVIARFGADEFAILQVGGRQPHSALALAQRLVGVLAEPVNLENGTEAITGASIGVSVYPTDGNGIDDLVRNAGLAMARARADGRGTYRFFEPEMDQLLGARRKLERRLRKAIQEDAFSLHYQPLVNADTLEPVGFEALLRWTDNELGFVSPGEFIPVAEETGQIVEIGKLALQRACAEAARWPDPLSVAVNLSAAQFRRRELVEAVRNALTSSGLPGRRLELEVTESILIQDQETVLDTLNALNEMGVRTSMDDFGTGFSSLSYLQSFPFGKLKIDRSFIAGLESNESKAAIIRAVSAMGHSLGMRVVAEGVETAEQAELLRRMACDELQGFLIARPMKVEDVGRYLTEKPACEGLAARAERPTPRANMKIVGGGHN